MKTCITLALLGLVALTGCGGATTDADGTSATADELSVTSSFTSRGTGYYPDSSALEGGFKDRAGKPLHTLQQFLAGTAPYAAVAMDTTAFKYGQRLRIKELESKYGKTILFRVVDTGGAFRGKGRSRIDICTANNKASLDPTINGTLHIDALSESASDADTTTNDTGSGSTSDDSDTSGGSTGTACTGDGTCNPGNDGSGMICSSGSCMKGCHTNAQCPGSTTCQSGQCR